MVDDVSEGLTINVDMEVLLDESLIAIKSFDCELIFTPKFSNYFLSQIFRFAFPLNMRQDMVNVVGNDVPFFCEGVHLFFSFLWLFQQRVLFLHFPCLFMSLTLTLLPF